MPTQKTLRAPDGRTRVLTIPDGATDEQIASAVMRAKEAMMAEGPKHIVRELGEAAMGRVIKPVYEAGKHTLLNQPHDPDYYKSFGGQVREMGNRMLDLGTVAGTVGAGTTGLGAKLLAGGVLSEALLKRLGANPTLARVAGSAVELGGALAPKLVKSTIGAVRRAGASLVREELPRVSTATRASIGREYRTISHEATARGLALEPGDSEYDTLRQVIPNLVQNLGSVATPRRDVRALIEGVGDALVQGLPIPYSNLEQTRRWLNAVRPRGQYSAAPVQVNMSQVYDTLTGAMRQTLGKSTRTPGPTILQGQHIPPGTPTPQTFEGSIVPSGPPVGGPPQAALPGGLNVPAAGAPPTGGIPPAAPGGPPPGPGVNLRPSVSTGPMPGSPAAEGPDLVGMFDSATGRWRDEVIRMAQPLMQTRHNALRKGGGAQPVLDKAQALAKSRAELGDPGVFRRSQAPIDRVAKLMAKMDRASRTAPEFLRDPLVRSGGIIGAVGAAGATPYQILVSQSGTSDKRGQRQVKSFNPKRMLMGAAAGGLLGASAGRLGTLMIRGMRIPADSDEGRRIGGLILKEIGRLESQSQEGEEPTP